MTYLLAAGCTWTDANFKSYFDDIDCSFPKWPEVLGKQLGISEVVNVGMSGAGNDLMFARCFDKMIAKKPELVCILLSSWDRQAIFDYGFIPSTDVIVYQMYMENSFPSDQPWLEEYFNNRRHSVNVSYDSWVDGQITLDNLLNTVLRNIFLFQNFCEQHNINYIIMQGVDAIIYPFGDKNFTAPKDDRLQDIGSFLKYILKSPYTSKINEENILGWPMAWQLDGYCVFDKFRETDLTKFIVHPNDCHPNKLGHRTIAEMFYKGYQDIYGKIS